MPAFVAAAGVLPPGVAGQSPESRDNPWTYGLWFIPVFMWFMSPVILTLLVCVCYRLFRPPGGVNRRGAGANAGAGAGALPPNLARRGPGGLDAAAIATLPLVFYRDVRRHRIAGPRDGDDALECSVCLLQFDDDDALRLLPTCPHAFHPECIALWLERHATCPLCRASLLDAPAPSPQPQPQLQQPPATAPIPPDSPPHDPTVVLIGDAGDRDDGEDWSRIQLLARNRRGAGREVLPRSNSTGHDGATTTSSNTERFALRLPEHVRMEIVMSHRLRHVTSAVESVRVREGSAHGSTVGGSVRSAVARLLSRIAPGAGSRGDGDDKSFKADPAGASSSLRRRENSSRGAAGEEKRSA